MKGKIVDSNIAEALIILEDFSTINIPLNKLPSSSKSGDNINLGITTSCSSSRSRLTDFF